MYKLVAIQNIEYVENTISGDFYTLKEFDTLEEANKAFKIAKKVVDKDVEIYIGF